MCRACWIEDGAPRIDNERVRAAVPLIAAVYDAPGGIVGGQLHVIVDDYNVSDEVMASQTRTGADFNSAELACYAHLLTMTPDERLSALALHDGYWP